MVDHRQEAGVDLVALRQDLVEVERVCRRVYLLDTGRCRAEGALDELLGTGDRRLVVRGLDEDAMSSVESAVRQAGGEVLRIEQERRELAALFRNATDAEAR